LEGGLGETFLQKGFLVLSGFLPPFHRAALRVIREKSCFSKLFPPGSAQVLRGQGRRLPGMPIPSGGLRRHGAVVFVKQGRYRRATCRKPLRDTGKPLCKMPVFPYGDNEME
jgi:hypothetical protein